MDYRSAGTRCEDDFLENDKGVSAANEHKGALKRGGSHTRGTAMSFGFRRRPASGIPMPITNYTTETSLLHPRSKSAGPEQNRRRDDDNINMIHSSSGRSTPRLAPPKKESSGIAVRTNRFGYRQPQAKFTNKVSDICSSHSVSHYNQEKLQQQQQQQQEGFVKQPHRVVQASNVAQVTSKMKQPQAMHNSVTYNNTNATHTDGNRKVSGIPEPIGRYTLHTSHLPLPQYAVRMTDANSKTAKTAANQSRKVSAASKSSASSKEGSSTEDSGVGSQQGCPGENDSRGVDYTDGSLTRRRGLGKPRNLRMVVNGKSFDVRDVRDDDSTVTEISVIPLPKTFTAATTGLVRERATQYQRNVNKDNRYTESTTSMSTTSSEGYDEGLGEEKVYKDRSHSEKIPSIKSDFSPPSSDDPEYGHGEAMADEYSLSSSDECQRSSTLQHLQNSSNTAKNGTLPKTTLRSVLLSIEDPAFAAAAATSTTLIDDETSPVDSLFDSLTASITQSDAKAPKKENVMQQSGNTIDDDSPGTPTNASNSLSLSEGREFFDDEIADQPGLVFDDNSKAAETQSAVTSQVVTENSHTLIESSPKTGVGHEKTATNSPHHGKRISRAGSIDTLSPCESIASDDLILDYEQSDASSYEEQQHRVETSTALQDMDNATILSELEAKGEEVMRQWTSLLGTCQTQQHTTNNSNTINNNVNAGSGNNNNQPGNEIGALIKRVKQLQSPDEDSAGGDYYQLTYPN
ncbi:PREDICTED: putative mediator of RNA polymerase II transcription subunit 26 isoform X2 [Habropoda laboriosa]|uniref:putative mediator of RNA polymerase II transcription subunit 26 isoform X2 n=1 Tax=Habropoda laboriosa TaxID=597456 RepID=UPI00083DCF30|nr:PREDICTED: putative mediator of RNA polymerase II transcription subunit 26 isoform X2 [Habropoda laboriosa]